MFNICVHLRETKKSLIMNSYLRTLRFLLFLAFLILTTINCLCQEYGYDVAIKNFRQTDETAIEWDIYLRKAPQTEDFALYMMQVRLEFNNDILNTGNFESDGFTITGIGPETNQHAAFFNDNDCTVTGIIPNRQLNWAITNPPGTGDGMTTISEEWIHIAGFRARLSKNGHAHHFAGTCPEFAFQASGSQVIVRRANNTNSTYDGHGSAIVPRNSAIPETGTPVESRQMAAYHFSGNGCWSDNTQWNTNTHENANTIPTNISDNIIISGHATINETTNINTLSVISTQSEMPTVITGSFKHDAWDYGFFSVENNYIPNEGKQSVLEKGILVGKDESPDINSYSVIFPAGEGLGSFVIFEIPGHGVEEGDYFRAYAVSEVGTAYGQSYRVSDLGLGDEAVGGLTEVPGTLTIGPAGRLTASSIYNDTDGNVVLIRSTPSGTGSLIHGNDDLEAKVQQFIPASEGWLQKSPAPDHWYWISPPTGVQPVDTFLDALEEGSGYDLYRWDEQADQWINHKGTHFGQGLLRRGKGYLFAAQSDATYSYSGILFSGDHTWEGLSRGNTEAEHGPGWHLVGNPYASGLEYNNEHWESSSVSYTPQYWVEEDGSYSAYLEGQVIPPATAFFVEALADNASLTVGKSARVHHDQALKSRKSGQGRNSDYIILSAHPVKGAAPEDNTDTFDAAELSSLPLKSTSRQRSYIRIVPDLGDGLSNVFDNRYHSRFRSGDAPVFYSAANAEKLLVHAINERNDPIRIPYHFKKNNESNTFRIKLEKNTTDTPLLLHDLKTNLKHDLTTGNPYTFLSSPGDDPYRFELTIGTGKDQETEPGETPVADVWVQDNILNLISRKKNTEVRLYDMKGHMVHTYQAIKGRHSFHLRLPSGIYLLHMNAGHHVQSEKIYIGKGP
jgi:hypothetical protein